MLTRTARPAPSAIRFPVTMTLEQPSKKRRSAVAPVAFSRSFAMIEAPMRLKATSARPFPSKTLPLIVMLEAAFAGSVDEKSIAASVLPSNRFCMIETSSTGPPATNWSL